jgi:hypothetical protein
MPGFKTRARPCIRKGQSLAAAAKIRADKKKAGRRYREFSLPLMSTMSLLPATPVGGPLFGSNQSLLTEPVPVLVVWAVAGKTAGRIKLRTKAKAAWHRTGNRGRPAMVGPSGFIG